MGIGKQKSLGLAMDGVTEVFCIGLKNDERVLDAFQLVYKLH
jgi:hypothetical protein